ncbi:hypothetical protein LCGC14_2930060 [marine sediment metagenome]|uniref:Uncharacterized protein n=1 Tax=marine sediment metagenome TaxID=412755 RepID=A0A0F9AC99_9ZZZZ
MMRNWKDKGIILDPDIGVGDDYAQFCTHDEAVSFMNIFDYVSVIEDK